MSEHDDDDLAGKIALLELYDVEFFFDTDDELYAVDVQPEQVVYGGEIGDVNLHDWSLDDIQKWLGY